MTNQKTLEEFVKQDEQMVSQLLDLNPVEQSKLVKTAIKAGYTFEEQSILVDVLNEKFETNISVYHEDNGNTAQSVLMFEQWADEYLNRSK